MSIVTDPILSRKAAKVVQKIPAEQYWGFVSALSRADKVSDLQEPYKTWMLSGYKTDKVSDNIKENK